MRTPRNEPLGSDSSALRPPRNRAAGTEEATPERKCVLTGQNGSRDEFLRLAISPDGQVLPDALARAPGRGAWIGVTRAELDEAIASGRLRGALARAFKGAKLSLPEDLGAMAQDALTRAFLQRLGLEMRSGKLILGSDRIAQQARGGAVAWLGHAADASDDGCRKLDQAYRVGMDAEGSGLTGERLPLDRAALSVALGRDNVVHLALADHGSAERVAIPLRRLMRFTGAYPAAEGISPEGAANGAAHHAEVTG
ncbi:hypothetical protein SZ64_17785 [Erythrobacter sp. SG61-1L]|uniref:DUF448 domain-containing protein n=1 Tax=Erythrobacter sp. SG61-1L TaxID=1603897 RepID=UPI0006C93A09|nr:DUF448 domain-containing protein [Erythrobacter sp. SG61-1L]KPL69761.1 hypothetical protein SZ64_17660 [Erythrobacter sp. SG61-1L]KPL69786.1 hypothetical protein SZ64_17785 [Erythrobacter sp. SG61-1L]